MPWNDPMGDSSDPESSNYGGDSGDDGRGGEDSYSRNYAAMGRSYNTWSGEKPSLNWRAGDTLGTVLTGGKWGMGRIGKFAKEYGDWNRSAPYGSKANGSVRTGDIERDRNGGTYNANWSGEAGFTPMSLPTGATANGGGIYPSVYSDPVTGRLLYQSMSPGGTSNQSYADQSMIDQLMGTKVAGQNVAQEISNLQGQIEAVKKAGGDTSWYENELKRLQGLGSTGVDQNNPMLAWLNSGLQERVANEQLDNTVANTMKSSDELAARRGLGNLASPMQDAVRASLGLSTAQARNQNKLTAGNNTFDKKLSMLSFLKNSQGQDFNQGMGRTGIGMTLGDWENQRKIAEIAQKNQNSQFNQNMDFLRDQQGDVNRNAWLNTIGNIAGGVDWGSFF